jgi:hypothetical protein
MTDHRRYCVPDATVALLDYLEARHPQVPHLQLYFVTPAAVVVAAAKYDIDSDWYRSDHVIDEVDRRLNEGYVATRRKIPMDYFAEWDLKAK